MYLSKNMSFFIIVVMEGETQEGYDLRFKNPCSFLLVGASQVNNNNNNNNSEKFFHNFFSSLVRENDFRSELFT